MKTIEQETLSNLTKQVYDIIAKAVIELQHKTDGKSMATLSKIFAASLKKDFKNLTINQVADAFYEGTRNYKEKPFISIWYFYKWLHVHKKVIDNAYYEVNTLGKPADRVLYYQDKQKLLK
ncbi:MAG: hypothetical protein Unbinned3904contig1002_20 [Prokaryotic dsDNA virus sp.]|nr:MAG: hypothetical protein Unbinned3904contig1002_20 [Prokaryotic dsDNA virus sp.]|tara:strand:+ start:7567 stop:7929 length:363 start_codon:yes stop_codon:yes gene_type:complete